jgi:hypothetical protein
MSTRIIVLVKGNQDTRQNHAELKMHRTRDLCAQQETQPDAYTAEKDSTNSFMPRSACTSHATQPPALLYTLALHDPSLMHASCVRYKASPVVCTHPRKPPRGRQIRCREPMTHWSGAHDCFPRRDIALAKTFGCRLLGRCRDNIEAEEEIWARRVCC